MTRIGLQLGERFAGKVEGAVRRSCRDSKTQAEGARRARPPHVQNLYGQAKDLRPRRSLKCRGPTTPRTAYDNSWPIQFVRRPAGGCQIGAGQSAGALLVARRNRIFCAGA